MPLKWGIAGAGNVSREFVKSVQIHSVNDHQVVAVAAKNLERAQDFAKDLSINKAYGDYKSLAEDKEIDIIYIGNLNTQHFDTAILSLSYGKHVLCEKPLTLNEKQTQTLIKYAQEKKLFLMEAVWSRCFPVYKKLKELINSGVIGDVLYISACFGLMIDKIERIASKELGGGTILDLGLYPLQFIQLIYDGIEPISITAKGHLNNNGVDESASAILLFPEGKIGLISSHSRVLMHNEACVIGTKGTFKIPNFWCPTTIITSSETLTFELPKTEKKFKDASSVGLSYEIAEVGNCIKSGLLESPRMTHKETIQLAQWMDKVRKDIGVVFKEDTL